MEKHIFGFTSLQDFLLTITGLRNKTVALYEFSAATVMGSITLHQWVNEWLWNPSWLLWFFFGAITFDHVLGMLVGMKVRKEGFVTQKAMRFPGVFITHMVFLGVFFNLQKLAVGLGFPEAIADDAYFIIPARAFFLYTFLIHVGSAAKNAAMLGYMKGKLAEWILKNIDPHKFIRHSASTLEGEAAKEAAIQNITKPKTEPVE